MGDFQFFRCRRSNNISSKYHHGGEPTKELKIAPSRVSTRSVSIKEGISRRDLVLIGLSSPLSTLLPLSSSPGKVFIFYYLIKLGLIFFYFLPKSFVSELLVE